MGRHASAERRRSVATWPIVVGVVVVLLAIATVGYFKVIDDDQHTAACSATTVLPVVVAPGAAPAITQAAHSFNATKPEARSTCVSVSVTTVSGPAAVAALAGGWSGQRTPAPGLWIADSTADVAALDASDPAMTAGHPTRGLASSPVVLAARQAPAGTPVSWTSLAAGSGGLTLGIGNIPANRAATAALQSLVRGASSTPSAGAAIDTAAIRVAAPALARLAAGSSTVPPTTELALVELAAGTSRYTAVPVVESELATFNAARGTTLTAIYPTGPTAADEVLPVPLTAAWVSSAMSDAAAAFDGYLGDAAGTKILTAAHLRTAAAPVTAVGVNLKTSVADLSDAGAPAGTALAAAWKAATVAIGSAGTATGSAGTATGSAGTATGSAGTGTTVPGPVVTTRPTAPSTSAARTTTSVALTSTTLTTAPVVTFLVDTSKSMSTVDNGAQRLTWVKSAVSTVVQLRPGGSFGLSTFSTGAGAGVPVGPPDQLIGGIPRSSAIIGALNRSTPSGNSFTYGAIRTVFAATATTAVPGAAQRVILLTDGSDSTPGLTRDAVKTTVAGLAALHPGLRLDIIGLSASVNERALDEIATAGGGRFTLLATLADLEPTLLALSS